MNTVLAKLDKLQETVDRIEADEKENSLAVEAHPIIFVGLLILFFIAMNFWMSSAHEAMKHFHPRGDPGAWEYFLVGLSMVVIVFAISRYSGIKVKMIAD